MGKEIEEWRDVPNYEGYYQVSDMGMVRSLDRTVVYPRGGLRFYKGGVIKGVICNGYRQTTLMQNNEGRTYKFSQLVAMAFLGHEPNGYKLVIDHINGDRSDDRVDNLRIVSHRANTSTCFRSNEDSLSSKYVGVSWGNRNSKWVSKIKFNGKTIGLGYFDNEIDASKAYQSALSKIKDGSFNLADYKPKFTSEYKGVTFHKTTRKWMAQIIINGERKHIGLFPSEIEAHRAYLKASDQRR